MSRADNPKYRRIVPRGRVSIRRQFILKSRGIGRDWSGESGPSSPPAFRVVKYSRRGDPEGFSQPIQGEPKAVEEEEEERERRQFHGSAYRPRTGTLFPPSFPFVAALLTPPVSSIHLSHYSSLPPSYPSTDNALSPSLFTRWTSIN